VVCVTFFFGTARPYPWQVRKVGFKARLSLGSLLFAVILQNPAQAEELSIDALAPGNISNCNSPVSGRYGNTVVAGTTTAITKIEFITQSYMTAPANSIQVKVSTGAPMSTTGTLVGTFTQASVASSPSDGGDKYRITFTGSANVIQGTTYYIQPSYVSASSDQNLCLSSNSYSALSGWSLPKNGNDYIDVWNTGTFNWFAYHKMRITTGEVINSPSFNSFQLPSNSKSAIYGTSTSITATVAAASKVTFFANNKRIAKCVKVQTTGTAPNITATCNWKPSQRGAVSIFAQAFPIDTSLTTARSSVLNISVRTRTVSR